MPDVVHTLRTMTDSRAVLELFVQFISDSIPKTPRKALNSPSGWVMNVKSTATAAELAMAGK